MKKDSDGYRPNVFQLIVPFWKTTRSWKSWIMVAVALGYSFGSVYLAVWANRLAGEVVNAMVKRQWEHLWPVLVLTLSVSVGTVIISIMNYVAQQLLTLEWRTWMTGHYLDAWTKNGAYYEIERDGLLTNADQRISQDINLFIQDTLSLTLNMLQVVVSVISFGILLWNLSGTLKFTLWRLHVSIPGYMVYLVVLYQIIAFVITHYSGRALIWLQSDQQTVEANFRYHGMQLRENAEQVAFYRGGERERQRLDAHFGDIVRNWKSIIFCTGRMMFLRDTYVQTGSIVPTLAALPRYLAGAISLGDVTRITGAFNQVSSALSFFTQAYTTFAEWLAAGNRLRNLSAAIDRAEKHPRDISVTRHAGDDIELSRITLRQPSGDMLTQVAAMRIQQGERWLIRGRSGVGKSTFLRAVAGMWPYGDGTVMLPESASLMFLPQRSYIPDGSLKAALCYPAAATHFSDEQCRWVLATCQLSSFMDLLSVQKRWQRTLSGGEQQRLAMARALLHRPAFVFMDEATSALDPQTERALYTALVTHLGDSAIISVAHRASLDSFHEHVLELGAASTRRPRT